MQSTWTKQKCKKLRESESYGEDLCGRVATEETAKVARHDEQCQFVADNVADTEQFPARIFDLQCYMGVTLALRVGEKKTLCADLLLPKEILIDVAVVGRLRRHRQRRTAAQRKVARRRRRRVRRVRRRRLRQLLVLVVVANAELKGKNKRQRKV